MCQWSAGDVFFSSRSFSNLGINSSGKVISIYARFFLPYSIYCLTRESKINNCWKSFICIDQKHLYLCILVYAILNVDVTVVIVLYSPGEMFNILLYIQVNATTLTMVLRNNPGKLMVQDIMVYHFPLFFFRLVFQPPIMIKILIKHLKKNKE